MTDHYSFGLIRNPEKEKEEVFSFLNKKTIVYKPLLSELIDTAYSVQENKVLMDSELKIFEKGLYESYIVVFCHYSGKLLCQLSYVNKSVQDLFMRLAAHPSSKVRLNIITNMLYRPCKPVLDYVIEKGLNDKSATVRAKTADVIERLELKEYAKTLPNYVNNEVNEKVKKDLEHCLYWITHDYQIYDKTELGYSIWVKTEYGLTGVTINEEQYKNIDKTIEKIKSGDFE